MPARGNASSGTVQTMRRQKLNSKPAGRELRGGQLVWYPAAVLIQQLSDSARLAGGHQAHTPRPEHQVRTPGPEQVSPPPLEALCHGRAWAYLIEALRHGRRRGHPPGNQRRLLCHLRHICSSTRCRLLMHLRHICSSSGETGDGRHPTSPRTPPIAPRKLRSLRRPRRCLLRRPRCRLRLYCT